MMFPLTEATGWFIEDAIGAIPEYVLNCIFTLLRDSSKQKNPFAAQMLSCQIVVPITRKYLNL